VSKVVARPRSTGGDWFENPDTGVLIPPLGIRRFLEWYASPEKPRGLSTIEAYAEHSGVPLSYLRGWFKDHRFLAALAERCEELNLRPDRIQSVLDAVWDRATGGDIKAAELYLRYVGRLVPVPKQVQVTVKQAKDLSEDELKAELARLHKAAELTRGETVDAEVVGES
jgi:hypothetical protein